MAIHYYLTRLAIALGPRNPLVRSLIRRRCRNHGVTFSLRTRGIELHKGNRAMRLAERHFVYAPDMAKRFDTYFSPVVPQETEGMLVVDYSTPRLQTYKQSGLQFELASFPEEDDAIQGYFHWYTPQPGETVFDIGAHCGVSAYHFSRLVGSAGKVIAFEPDPLNYSLLIRNIERHKLDNVTPVKMAIAASRGRAEFHCEGTIGSQLACASSRATVGSVEIVETMTLADAFEKWGTPALCKIDIEGSEVAALEASRELFRHCKAQFAIDTNHMVNGELTKASIEKVFSSCDYEVESLPIQGMMTTWARPRRA